MRTGCLSLVNPGPLSLVNPGAEQVSTLTLVALLWERYSHVVPLTSIDQLGIVLYHDYEPNRSQPNGDPIRSCVYPQCSAEVKASGVRQPRC